MISSSHTHCCGFLFLVSVLHTEGIYFRNSQNHTIMPVPQGELDGGGIPWLLFSSQAPGELPEHARTQAFVRANADDPIAKKCCPGDTWGYWYYNVSQPTLVPFIIGNSTPGRANAAIIIAPGGGFEFLAWHKEGTRIALWLNSLGFSAFVLKYRVPSKADTALKAIIDAQRAVSLVKFRAHEFGLDQNQIGFMGFSAGGALAAKVSCTEYRTYLPIDAADALPHVPNYQLIIYGAGDDCPASVVPTTFMAIATDDQCVSSKNAANYYALIRDKNATNQHEEHIYGSGRHGYGDCSVYVEGDDFRDVCSWTINAQMFLKSVILKNFKYDLSGSPLTYTFHN